MNDATRRIAINGWFWGQDATGSGQYVRHLVQQLPAVDFAATWLLICPQPLPDTARQALPPAWQVHVAAPPAWLPGHHLAKVWFEQVSFPRACHALGADLAHVPYWGSPWWSPCPVVVTIHDLIPQLLPAYRGGFLPRAYTWLVGRTARRATSVITDSRAAQHDIVQTLSLPVSQVRVVYLAADDRYRRVVETGELVRVRTRYALPARFVLYMGGFDIRKNVAGVLRAFALAVSRGALTPEVGLVIAGQLPASDTPFHPDPRALAHDLGLHDRVVFTGWVAETDKPALYSLADVFLFPSTYEGFGLPVLEALACGAPVEGGEG